MERHTKRSHDTHERLLTSACEVFAEKGFHGATIAEIVDRAGANIAAVNYHFGDKEGLYVEAWRHSFQQSLARHPPDGGVADDAPAEARLRARLRALLARIVDDESREFAILCTELANPTGLLDEVRRDAIRPVQEKIAALVRELLGPRASDDDVLFCQVSIVSQCLHLMTRRRLVARSGAGGPRAIRDYGAYADHVAAFSLAGLRAVRERIEREAAAPAGPAEGGA